VLALQCVPAALPYLTRCTTSCECTPLLQPAHLGLLRATPCPVHALHACLHHPAAAAGGAAGQQLQAARLLLGNPLYHSPASYHSTLTSLLSTLCSAGRVLHAPAARQPRPALQPCAFHLIQAAPHACTRSTVRRVLQLTAPPAGDGAASAQAACRLSDLLQRHLAQECPACPPGTLHGTFFHLPEVLAVALDRGEGGARRHTPVVPDMALTLQHCTGPGAAPVAVQYSLCSAVMDALGALGLAVRVLCALYLCCAVTSSSNIEKIKKVSTTDRHGFLSSGKSTRAPRKVQYWVEVVGKGGSRVG
jgi:hypothetical protein